MTLDDNPEILGLLIYKHHFEKIMQRNKESLFECNRIREQIDPHLYKNEDIKIADLNLFIQDQIFQVNTSLITHYIYLAREECQYKITDLAKHLQEHSDYYSQMQLESIRQKLKRYETDPNEYASLKSKPKKNNGEFTKSFSKASISLVEYLVALNNIEVNEKSYELINEFQPEFIWPQIYSIPAFEKRI